MKALNITNSGVYQITQDGTRLLTVFDDVSADTIETPRYVCKGKNLHEIQ